VVFEADVDEKKRFKFGVQPSIGPLGKCYGLLNFQGGSMIIE